MEVTRFDPERAGEDVLAGCARVVAASQEVAPVPGPRVTVDTALWRLRNPFTGFGPAVHWAARRDGAVVGTAVAYFPDRENTGMALTMIHVHPDARRRGAGTAVLREVVAEAVRRGRTSVEGWQVDENGPGAAWAAALGFTVVRRAVTQALDLSGHVDPARWDVPVAAGYRLVRWRGAAPDDLVESFARARGAIADSPLGDSDYEHPDWTVERIRTAEAEQRRHGVEERVVAAVHEPIGEVVGLTAIEVRPHTPTWPAQRDTAVLAAHRGRGLGVAMKAHMLRWLVPEQPTAEGIVTMTGAENEHMIRVNHAMGYDTVGNWVAVRREVRA